MYPAENGFVSVTALHRAPDFYLTSLPADNEVQLYSFELGIYIALNGSETDWSLVDK